MNENPQSMWTNIKWYLISIHEVNLVPIWDHVYIEMPKFLCLFVTRANSIAFLWPSYSHIANRQPHTENVVFLMSFAVDTVHIWVMDRYLFHFVVSTVFSSVSYKNRNWLLYEICIALLKTLAKSLLDHSLEHFYVFSCGFCFGQA